MSSANNIPLTTFSHGAGCGCKIAPQALQLILTGKVHSLADPRLLVGNETNDDAAVYDLGDGTALIATTDFFMPIVDDAFDFGRVAAANAISDVYAMGGKPLLALAILGWPLEKLPAEVAARVVDGARHTCNEAGIILAGGHTIDNNEPLFGLSVNGLVPIADLKKNNSARTGDLIFLTKPLGTGIFSTAKKRQMLADEDYMRLVQQLCTLNSAGTQFGKLPGVHAMTDVTGFGLMGHLIEMASGSNLKAELWYENVHKIKNLDQYLAKNTVPDATFRNWNAYQHQVNFDDRVNVAEAFNLLPDPQTNGGLLLAVDPAAVADIQSLMDANGMTDYRHPIGRFLHPAEKPLHVIAERSAASA